MNNKEAVAVLNTIYGMVSPEVQKAIDVANKALSRDEELSNTKESDYYHIADMSDPECIVKIKENYHKCGDCKYLIFKDYRYNSGTCRICRLHRMFTDRCVHEEEMS